MKSDTILVSGMTCVHCQQHVHNLISAIEGVSEAAVNLEDGNVKILYDPDLIQIDHILDQINQSHYKATFS